MIYITLMDKIALHLPKDEGRPGLNYITSTFPSGEGYVKLTDPGLIPETVDIYYRWQGDSSLIQLFNFVNALRLKGAKKLNLFCPYFPGCRSDRVGKKNEGEALSSKVYAQLVNSLQFNEVVVFDPHSDVVPSLLDNRRIVTNHEFVAHILRNFQGESVIISPDAGANKKIFDLVEFLGGSRKVIRADKKRDVTTGQLVRGECTVFAETGELEGKTCFLIDDICSKGGTFITLAKELKKLGAGNIFLIVSHYEGVADQSELMAAGISRVFTTTSLINTTLPGSFVETTDIKALL